MSDRPLPDRCDAWGVFLRGRLATGCADSFEGRYRSPQRWDAPIPGNPVEVNVHDAWAIERAVSGMFTFEQTLLRAVHVRRANLHEALRLACKAGGRPRQPSYLHGEILGRTYGELGAMLALPVALVRARARRRAREALGEIGVA